MKDTLHRDLNSLSGLTESSEGPGWPDWKVTAIPEKGNISDYLKKAEQNLWLPRNLWGGGTSYLYTTKTVLFSCTNAPALLTCYVTQKWGAAPCGRPSAVTTQRPTHAFLVWIHHPSKTQNRIRTRRRGKIKKRMTRIGFASPHPVCGFLLCDS